MLSQKQIQVWLLSNGVYFILIHRNLTKSLKELCQIGLKGAERPQNEKRLLDFQSSISRKQGRKSSPVENINHFLQKKKDDSELIR